MKLTTADKLRQIANGRSDQHALVMAQAAEEIDELQKACRLIYRDLAHISPKCFDEEISDEAKCALEAVITKSP